MQYSRKGGGPICAHNIHYDSEGERDGVKNSVINLSTNLNGIYRENEEDSERGIAYCGNKDYSNCFRGV